jgi:hypothetical protein
VLLFQHAVLVLLFKQKLCLSLDRWWERLTIYFFLYFSGSCLDGSSLSEVWLVLRFWRSALCTTSHPALELGFCCVGLLGAYFFASCLFSGARSEIHQLALLSACYAGLLTAFQFCIIVWLLMLLTGSGDEFCGLLSALFQAAAYHWPTVGPSAFLVFVYWKLACRSVPFPFPLLQCI